MISIREGYKALNTTQEDKTANINPYVHEDDQITEPIQEWANGLRGVAASLVLVHHMLIVFDIRATQTSTEVDQSIRIWEWPILRAFVNRNVSSRST